MGLGIALGIRGVGWSTQSRRRSSERDRRGEGFISALYIDIGRLGKKALH